MTLPWIEPLIGVAPGQISTSPPGLFDVEVNWSNPNRHPCAGSQCAVAPASWKPLTNRNR